MRSKLGNRKFNPTGICNEGTRLVAMSEGKGNQVVNKILTTVGIFVKTILKGGNLMELL